MGGGGCTGLYVWGGGGGGGLKILPWGAQKSFQVAGSLQKFR